MSIELVKPSNYLVLCCPLLLLPSILSSISVFFNESFLHIRLPNYWSFSFSFPGGSEVKASACNVGDLGSIPGLGRSPGEGNGNPLQYSCLENPMDGGGWWATVHGVAKESDLIERRHAHRVYLNVVSSLFRIGAKSFIRRR